MAPARELPADVRARMLADAVKLAKAAHYTNAGTVEFLLDTKSGSYYFMEVNPRIQVRGRRAERGGDREGGRGATPAAHALSHPKRSNSSPPRRTTPLRRWSTR